MLSAVVLTLSVVILNVVAPKKTPQSIFDDSEKEITKKFVTPSAQCYKAFYAHNLRI
jgi:hypothetical protein